MEKMNYYKKINYYFSLLFEEEITLIGNEAKEFSKSSGKNISLYFMTEYEGGSANGPRAQRLELKISLQRTLDAVRQINSGTTKPIVGLYLNYLSVKSHKIKLSAVLEVFGPKESSPVQIGEFKYFCTDLFNSNITSTQKYLNRLNFISCVIPCHPCGDGNANTDAYVALYKCVKTQEAAKLKGIPAEIFCVMEYNSETALYPKNSSMYYDKFRAFWCKIVELTKHQNYPKIILLSAFPYYLNEDSNNSTPYCSSWWKRINQTSYSSGAYVEKVQLIAEPPKSSNVCMQSNCSSMSTEFVVGNSGTLKDSSKGHKNGPDCFPHQEPLCKSSVSDSPPLMMPNQSKLVTATPSGNNSLHGNFKFNCLQRYPNALDGHLNILNRKFDVHNFTGLDILKLLDLFSTRFESAHQFTPSLNKGSFIF